MKASDFEGGWLEAVRQPKVKMVCPHCGQHVWMYQQEREECDGGWIECQNCEEVYEISITNEEG